MKRNSSQFSSFPDQNIIFKTTNYFIEVKVKYYGLFSTEGLFLCSYDIPVWLCWLLTGMTNQE